MMSGGEPCDRVFDRAMECWMGVDHPAQDFDRDLGVHGNRKRTKHFTAGWPSRCGSEKHSGMSIGDQLDEPVVSRTIRPEL